MSDENIFEDVQKKTLQPITKDKLIQLKELTTELKNLRGDVNEDHKNEILYFIHNNIKDVSCETIMEILNTFEKEEELISRQSIPSILNECGLSELKLVTDEKIIVKDEVKVSIADKNIYNLYKEMIKEEMLSKQLEEFEAEANIKPLFKEVLTINEVNEETLNLLIENEIPYDNKKTIHPMTLKKYVTTKIEEGAVVPASINVFKYQETKIK